MSAMMKSANQNKENNPPKVQKTGTISIYNRLSRKIRQKKQLNSLIDDKSIIIKLPQSNEYTNVEVKTERIQSTDSATSKMPQQPSQDAKEHTQKTNRSSNIFDDSIDFLGKPPSEEPSESNDQPNEDANENTQQTNGSSVSRPSIAGQRQPRKQSNPKKKRKDRITMEIWKLKQSTKLLVPRLPFQRLAREVLQEFKKDYRMQSSSLECLQEAAESYLVQLFEDCYLLCLHRTRVTLTEKDIRLIQILRGFTEVDRR